MTPTRDTLVDSLRDLHRAQNVGLAKEVDTWYGYAADRIEALESAIDAFLAAEAEQWCCLECLNANESLNALLRARTSGSTSEEGA